MMMMISNFNDRLQDEVTQVKSTHIKQSGEGLDRIKIST
jgi:hypothetical protein